MPWLRCERDIWLEGNFCIPPPRSSAPADGGGPLCHFVTSPHTVGSHPLHRGGWGKYQFATLVRGRQNVVFRQTEAENFFSAAFFEITGNLSCFDYFCSVRFYFGCSCFDCFYFVRSYSCCSDFAGFDYCVPLKITPLSQILSVIRGDLYFYRS